MSDTKLCARCKEVKPLDAFGLAPRMKLGRKSYCRTCSAEYQKQLWRDNPEHYRAMSRARNKKSYNPGMGRKHAIKTMYGLDWDQYVAMIDDQGGKCAICDTGEPGGRGGWHIDHDHTTGTVRGLLCAGCNVGLGHFHDDPERLIAAARYLEAWRVAHLPT